jgi:AcrR family transcriptional regulator
MAKAGEARNIDEPAQDNVQRILAVAVRLFAERGYGKTTVRDVARAAHVTHPLIYHYFGSKLGLLAAATELTQSKMRAMVDRGGEPRDVILELMRENLIGSRSYILTLTRALADGMRPADWPGGFPTTKAILDLLLTEQPEGGDRSRELEVRARVGVAMAMAVGWVLLEDQVLEGVGLSAEHRDEARQHVLSAFLEILEPVLPPRRA